MVVNRHSLLVGAEMTEAARYFLAMLTYHIYSTGGASERVFVAGSHAAVSPYPADIFGGVAKRPKATVCKTVIRRFESGRRLLLFMY